MLFQIHEGITLCFELIIYCALFQYEISSKPENEVNDDGAISLPNYEVVPSLFKGSNVELSKNSIGLQCEVLAGFHYDHKLTLQNIVSTVLIESKKDLCSKLKLGSLICWFSPQVHGNRGYCLAQL